MTRFLVSHDVPVRGGSSRVAEWPGPTEDAPVILAVHGVTSSHRAWPLVAEALPEFRIIAPDLRGRGRSAHLPAPYGMRQHAEDCRAALEALHVDRALVIGHSMGAFVAATFAAEHPSRTEALLLVDGGLPLALPPGMSIATVMSIALGAALKRLSMTFESATAYREFWKVHPALVGHWSASLEAYVDYDLIEENGHFRASTPIAAVDEDSRELFGSAAYDEVLRDLPSGTSLLTAPRGLLNDPPGLYAPERIAEWKTKYPALAISEVPDINHYLIVMGERGASVVAAEARRLHALSNAP